VNPAPCAGCGHAHDQSQECADHGWTDWCPYVGLDCPADVLIRKAAQEAELTVRFGQPPWDRALPPPSE
jgi:hypothetical protein